MGRHAILAAALIGVVGLIAGPIGAQEVKQDAKSTSGKAKISSITQEQLNTADESANNFLLTNGNYAQTRFHPAKQIQAAVDVAGDRVGAAGSADKRVLDAGLGRSDGDGRVGVEGARKSWER